jgi:hypothetical protein
MKLNPCTLPKELRTETAARTKREQNTVRIDTAIKTALDELGDNQQCQAAFLRLLACVRSCTQLLKPTPGQASAGWVAPVFLINRLKNLAARRNHWIRPCELWRPETANLRLAFRSLAFHLLIRYPVPRFMDSAWDLAPGPERFRQQSWYILLGRGASFRALNLPLLLTRKMEHHVRQAPDHYSVLQALRYGESRGLGGSEALAREIVAGRLGQRIEHPEFWRTVLWFFRSHLEIRLEQVNPIIDFIQANKFAGEEVATENGAARRKAPWPDFSIKGRSLNSILRLAKVWHSELSMGEKGRSFSWAKSGISGYRFLEKRVGEDEDRDWSIQEILESRALQAEGRAMRHCVYSYASQCRRGETTIWSLRLRVKDREKSLVTIQADPRRRSIIQARAKCNLWPGVRCREIIRQWAASAGLTIDLHL